MWKFKWWILFNGSVSFGDWREWHVFLQSKMFYILLISPFNHLKTNFVYKKNQWFLPEEHSRWLRFSDLVLQVFHRKLTSQRILSKPVNAADLERYRWHQSTSKYATGTTSHKHTWWMALIQFASEINHKNNTNWFYYAISNGIICKYEMLTEKYGNAWVAHRM